MKVENAEITWLESGLPYSTNFQDIYYSKEDELAESRHVFLEANRLDQRWRSAARDSSFAIGELGFGSGLNFLQTCERWQQSVDRPARLHYIAFEKYPLTQEQIRRVHLRWPTLARQSAALLAQYTDHSLGCHRLQLAADITLDLYFGDAHSQLSGRMAEACPAIQCWFLDGFSPASNLELWEDSLMRLVAASSDATTTLSSYSVAGKVRAAIANAGFEVHKVEGFGRKRHSLFANRLAAAADTAAAPGPSQTPWFTLPRPRPGGRSAAVIGAGLAGCGTAYSLARRGWEVTVFDAGGEPAAGASGIARLALRCRLFNSHSAEAEFYLQAYLFALRQFAALAELDWDDCGVLQLITAMNKRLPLLPETLSRLYSERVVHRLDAAAASARAGLQLRDGAWHFPGGGAMAPGSLCRRYLEHPNIRLVLDTPVSALQEADAGWQLETSGASSDAFEAVVIANSHGAADFHQCGGLPLRLSRGQSTEIASTEGSAALACVVSGGRSVFPARSGRHTLSASYADDTRLELSKADTLENIGRARENFAEPQSLGEEAACDRVALRCNTPDRVPIVGMVPDVATMRAAYGELARNAKAKFNSSGHYLPGLYINVAHGSNGLASCPLSGEFIASLICGENLPLSRDMVNSLSPARFLISELKKQRG